MFFCKCCFVFILVTNVFIFLLWFQHVIEGNTTGTNHFSNHFSLNANVGARIMNDSTQTTENRSTNIKYNVETLKWENHGSPIVVFLPGSDTFDFVLKLDQGLWYVVDTKKCVGNQPLGVTTITVLNRNQILVQEWTMEN